MWHSLGHSLFIGEMGTEVGDAKSLSGTVLRVCEPSNPVLGGSRVCMGPTQPAKKIKNIRKGSLAKERPKARTLPPLESWLAWGPDGEAEGSRCVLFPTLPEGTPSPC